MTDILPTSEGRLARFDARLIRLETALDCLEKDIRADLDELRDEAKYTRRTALTTALTVLSSVLLAVLGLIFSWLVKG